MSGSADPHEQKLRDDIEAYGWHVIMLEPTGSEPGFAYTVGLFERFGHPEILLFGLPHDTAHTLLNLAAGLVRDGMRFPAGTRSGEILEAHEVVFMAVSVPLYEGYLAVARWFYGNDLFPAVQCVWPDAAGRFPWDEGADPYVREHQPLAPRIAPG